ncbi:MAG: ligase [Variovorax sp.]|nr:ligase [Variovorax sp.]
MHRRHLLSLLTLAALGPLARRDALALAGKAPPLMLAEVYRPNSVPLDDYWVSEKYDGVRGYWDGHQLWTRGGEHIAAPAWFTAPLPALPLDGELWSGRGRFNEALSKVRSQVSSDGAWVQMHFMVFDLPTRPGDFTSRLAMLQKLLPITDAPWVVAVPQQRATTHAALQALLDKTVSMGGEGLMLHRGASLYRAERNADLLKFKPYDDAEARVVGHVPGRGKHAGRLGALEVETPEGRRFRLGSGLTDAQREHPPAIGSWVTYRYNGKNPGGVPRFARFMRMRDDEPS